MKRNAGPCGVCGLASQSACTGCFAVFYCGGDHQKADWSQHKPACSKPYYVDMDPVAGRVLLAARDMEAGDIILKEKAAVVGPNIDSNSKPLCLGCFKSTEVDFVLCRICSAPLCRLACQTSPLHTQECKVLKQNPDALYSIFKNGSIIKRKKIPKNANFQIILVLRALLLKGSDVRRFKAVMGLQSHLQERQEMGKTQVVKQTILPVLQQLRIQDAHEDNVQTICGIFDTNCFELFPTGAGDSISGIFPSAAMMMHSCYKNTRLMFSNDHVLTLIARTKIKKGEKLYHTYARTFTPTNIRRIGLFSGKHFSCECVRCQDPTELGTFSSAFLCKCGGQVLATDPLDLTPEAVWTCDKCGVYTPALQIASEERRLMMELQSIERSDVPSMERFLTVHKETLHPNHSFLAETMKHLSVAYGNFPGYKLNELSEERLQLKKIYCSKILELVQALEPGLSTQKGLTLYELYQAKNEELSRRKTSKSITKEEFTRQREPVLQLLWEAFQLLSYEPENSLHGQLAADIAQLLSKQNQNVSQNQKM